MTNRGEIQIALGLFCVYIAITPGHYQSSDGMLIFHQARSLLYDGALVFREPFVFDDVSTTSLYGVGLSLLYLPGLVLASGLEPFVYSAGTAPWQWERVYIDPVYGVVGAPLQALLTAITAWCVGRLCGEVGLGHRASIAGMLLFGLASPALVYSRSDFSQPLAALCWAAGILAALGYRRTSAASPLAVAAAAVAWAILTRPLDGALLAVGVAGICLAGRSMSASRRPLAWLLGSVLFGVAVTLAINYGRYGSWLHNEYAERGAGFVVSGVGVLGLLLSPGRGLLWAFPAAWLSLSGAAVLWQRAVTRPAMLALAGLPLLLLLASGSWHMWWGGVCWGPRLLLPALPLLAVLAAAGLETMPARVRRPVFALVFVAGFVWAVPAVSVDLLGGWSFGIANAESALRPDAYPPIGAWQGLQHVFATGPLDRSAIDIAWFRMARYTGYTSLMVPISLVMIAGWVGLRAMREEKREPAG